MFKGAAPEKRWHRVQDYMHITTDASSGAVK